MKMSITQTQKIANLQNHQEELGLEVERVQELLMASETGRRIIAAELEMAETDELLTFDSLLHDEEMSQEEQDNLSYYVSVMFKRAPEQSMKMFGTYIANLALDPQYLERAPLYLALASAAKDITETMEYYDYALAVKEFNNDLSSDAIAARAAMESLESKIKIWSGI